MVRKNKFSKALKHIKKDYSLTEAPTNSLSGVYSLNQPGHKLGPVPKNAKVFLPDIDGNYPAGIPGTTGEPFYKRGDGHWTGERDWDTITEPNFSHESAGASGTDTTGLIAGDGTVLTALPPNSRSFILGPLVDGHTYMHGTDAYTNIGYIQKDTRQFVLLARVDGQWESGGYPIPSTAVQYGWGESRVWDGTANGFTAYNASFTLEMAQWFRSEMLERRFVKDVAYFYSGGVSQGPNPNAPVGGMYGGSGVGAGGDGSSASGGDAGAGYGSGGDPNIGDPQTDNSGDPEDAGFPWGWAIGSISAEDWAKIVEMLDAGMLLWDALAILGLIFPEPSTSAAGGLRLAARLRKLWKLYRSMTKGGGKDNSSTGSGSKPKPKPKPKPVDNADLPDYVNKADGPFTQDSNGSIRDRTGAEVVQPDGSPASPWQDSSQTSWGGTTGDGQGGYTTGGGSSKPSGGGSSKPSGGSSIDGVDLNDPRTWPSIKDSSTGSSSSSITSTSGGTSGGKGGKGGTTKDGGIIDGIKNWWNKGRDKGPTGPDGTENTASVGDLAANDWNQRGKPGDGTGGGWDPTRGFRPGVDADVGGFMSGPTPAVRQAFERPIRAIRDLGNKAGAAPGLPSKGALLNHNIDAGADMVLDKAINQLKNPEDLNAMADKFENAANQIMQDNAFSMDKLIDAGILDPGMIQDMKPSTIKQFGRDTKVAGAGGSPGQPYTPPKEDPNNPYVPAPGRGTKIAASPNSPDPVKPGEVPTAPSSPYLPGKSPYKVAANKNVKKKNKVLSADYKQLENELLSEDKLRILKEIKKPVVLIEASPKMTKLKGYRPNFKGKFTPQNTPDVTACKQSDGLVDKANARGQTWRTENRYWQGYETTERMNIVYDRMGHGQQAWDAIIEDARQKNGWKNREIQEQLNQIAHEKAMRKIDPDFESPWTLKEMEDPNQDEIDKYMKDPLVKRVRKRLLTQIDYPDKPSKKGYPDEPPKPQVDGWHPEFGKKSAYYKKLDPVSALAMPKQDDPEIDAEVEKQKKKYVKPKVTEEWKSDWRVNISSD